MVKLWRFDARGFGSPRCTVARTVYVPEFAGNHRENPHHKKQKAASESLAAFHFTIRDDIYASGIGSVCRTNGNTRDGLCGELMRSL